jgi:hypothetical protein
MKRFLLGCATLGLIATASHASAATLAQKTGIYAIYGTVEAATGAGCAGYLTVNTSTTPDLLDYPGPGKTGLEIVVPGVLGAGTLEVINGFPAIGATGFVVGQTLMGSATIYGAGTPIPLGTSTLTILDQQLADDNTLVGLQQIGVNTPGGACSATVAFTAIRTGH